MRRADAKGMTLVELLLSVALLGIISAAVTALLASGLQGYRYTQQKMGLRDEGLLAMEIMLRQAKKSTYILIPNAHAASRDILALSGYLNNDNDFYFNDPLFPRIDEDPQADTNSDGLPGLRFCDDNGDLLVDIGLSIDDDEDVLANEDPVDGVDNDLDGNIDEDPPADITNDGRSGIAGYDDDGDGAFDEGSGNDDDEDGSTNEDDIEAAAYSVGADGLRFYPAPQTFEGQPIIIAPHATAFNAIYERPTTNHGARLLLTLTLTGANGEVVQFSEYVFPRNIHQRAGKRVR